MAGRGARRGVGLWLVLQALGCEVVGGFEDFEAEAASAGGSGGTVAPSGGASGGGASGGAATCPEGDEPGSAGATMIQVMQADGTCFWIDETEVSRSDYDAFLAASVDPGLQPAYCAWNDDFTTTECEDAATTTPSTGVGEPITCVDQCDAAAYCAFAGKRLCAGEAGAGATDATVSEWFSACSNAGTTAYPYGDEHAVDACNTTDRPDTGCGSGDCVAVGVSELLTCDTDDAVTGLSGNVAEWTSECNAESGEQDDCATRGGSVRSNGADAQCSAVVSVDRSFADAFTGFRCCAD